MITIYQDDKTHKNYYVFDRKTKSDAALITIARHTHYPKTRLQIIPVWILEDELYLRSKRGATKMFAIITKG